MNLHWGKQEIKRAFCVLYQRTHIEVIFAYDKLIQQDTKFNRFCVAALYVFIKRRVVLCYLF